MNVRKFERKAGACLCDYFIANPHIVSDRNVIELGSGCGFTSLVVASCCGGGSNCGSPNSTSVFATDYSDLSLLNLEHNISINRKWLAMHNFADETETRKKTKIIAHGYLNWLSFGERYSLYNSCATTTSLIKSHDFSTIQKFIDADTLIAADVIYNPDYIDKLVEVVKLFLIKRSSSSLMELSTSHSREAIFCITQRNLETFELFLHALHSNGIHFNWIANGDDCEALPKYFEGNFVQRRSDIKICKLYVNEKI